MSWIERLWVTLARVHTGWQGGVQRLHGVWAGQSTVEYALVGALVVIAAAGALTLLGSEITIVFNRITNTLSGAAAGR